MLALWIACIGVVLPVLLLGLCMVRVKPVRVDRPGNLGGSDSWEDAGSWRPSGSIRRKELRERAVKMVFEIRERDGKGQGELARVGRELGGPGSLHWPASAR